MKKTEAIRKLERLGTAQNRKVYARHGITGKLFGVSYANLGKLKKEVKQDHALALGLWKSGVHDARILATMVADPEQMTAGDLDLWAKDLDNYPLTDAFSSVAARTAHGKKRLVKWTGSRNEWLSSAGWQTLAHLAGTEELGQRELEGWLKKIEAGIHKAPNRTRYAMNSALISIGIQNDALQKKATAAAKRIGKVQVDHGETGCKTPDAVPYIAKAVAHKKKMKAKKTAKKRTKARA